MLYAQVASIVKDTVKHPGMVAQRLATEAINAGSGDNITVAVAFLRPDWTDCEMVASKERHYESAQLMEDVDAPEE